MTPACTTIQLSDVCLETGWSPARSRWEQQRGAGFKPVASTWSSLTFISSKMAKDFDFSFHFGLILAVTVQQNRFLEESHLFYKSPEVSESFNEKKRSGERGVIMTATVMMTAAILVPKSWS